MKLSEIVSRLGAQPEGTGFLAHCPSHDDTHESLRIDVTGDGRLLVVCRAGCPQSEVAGAIRDIPFTGIEVDIPSARPASDSSVPVSGVAQAQVAAYLSAAAGRLTDVPLDYLSRRFGVDEELARLLGLGFDPGGYEADFSRPPFIGRMYCDVPRLVVPFRDADGVPRGFQGRDLVDQSRAKWSGPSNPPEGGSWSRTAFFEAGAGIDYIVVTEGPGDALTSVAHGIDAVAIRGVSHAPAVVDELARVLHGRRVVLAGDNDRAGQTMNERLGRALAEAGLSVHALVLPDGIGDVSEWFESDPDEFGQLFQDAVTTAPAIEAPRAAAPSAAEEDQSVVRIERLRTAVGAAEELRRAHEGEILHAGGLGFMLYEGGRWIRDPGGFRTRALVHKLAEDLEEEGERRANEEMTYVKTDGGAGIFKVRTELRRAAGKLRQTYFIDNLLRELRAMVPVDVDQFDRRPDLLSFRNKVVNLRTGDAFDHSPDLMLTHRLELDYDPEAEAPRWLQFLEEVMSGDAEMSAYLQRLVGYGITGRTSEQCFAVLWGTGANGKSIFTDTLSHVFAGITETTAFSTFEEKQSGGIPNDLAALRGSRLVFASEGEQGRPMAEAVIKRITGQDLITARFMREEFFSFRPTFLIVLGTNFKPNFRGQDEGLWRRVKLIPFKRYFKPEERDHYLGQKLEAEAQGIVAWAVRGAVEWFASGLGDPDAVVSATKDYRDVSDNLAGFFPDGPLARGSDTDSMLGSHAYEAYAEWCDEEQLPIKERWTRRTFYSALEERGVFRRRSSKGIRLYGVKPAEPDDPEPPSSSSSSSIFGGAR